MGGRAPGAPPPRSANDLGCSLHSSLNTLSMYTVLISYLDLIRTGVLVRPSLEDVPVKGLCISSVFKMQILYCLIIKLKVSESDRFHIGARYSSTQPYILKVC